MKAQNLEIDNYEDENFNNDDHVDIDEDEDDADYEAQFEQAHNKRASSNKQIQNVPEYQAYNPLPAQNLLLQQKPPQARSNTIQQVVVRGEQLQQRKYSNQAIPAKHPQQPQIMQRTLMSSIENDHSQPHQQVLHQFNQPHIVNYTQNAFYGPSPYSQPLNYLSHQGIGLPAYKPKPFGPSPTEKNKRRRPTSAVHNSTMRSKEEERHQNYFFYNAASGKQKQSLMTDFQNQGYRKKIIPNKMFYDQEALYDQNILVKMQSNELKEENLQMKTKLQNMIKQIRDKDKLIDEIYKSAYITANGQQASKNLNKEILMIVKLKKKLHDYKDILNTKEAELTQLRRQMKNTKIKELEIENRAIMQECFRLRGIAENSMRLSGELDVERMTKERNLEHQNYNNQLQSFQIQSQILENEIQKLKNDLKSEQDEVKDYKEYDKANKSKINQLKLDIEKLIQNHSQQVQERDQKIKTLKENIKDQKQENMQLAQTLNETKKLIPLRPEREYIEEIDQKNEKIQELLDELLQKDTLIDQQAVLNKNIQKKADGLTSQLNEMVSSKEKLESMVEVEVKNNQDLQNVINAMKKKLAEEEQDKYHQVEELTKTYEERLKVMNKQIEENIRQKLDLENKVKILSKVDTVKKEDPAVQEGLQKIKILCQIKEIRVDEVESLIFENYRPETKFNILQLSSLLKDKFSLSNENSVLFARYLIEPNDQDKIEYSETAYASSSTIVVRIMNQIRNTKIFKDEDFKKIKKEIGSEIVREETISQLEDILSYYGSNLSQKEVETILKELKLHLDAQSVEGCFIYLLKKSNSTEKVNTETLLQLIREAETAEMSFINFSKMHDSAQKQDTNNPKKFSASLLEGSGPNFNIQEEQEEDKHEEQNKSQPKVKFDIEQVPETKDTKTIIQEKLLENCGKDLVQGELMDEILETTNQIFSDISNTLKRKNLTTRELFKSHIYTVPFPRTLQEVEVMHFDTLKSEIEKLIKKPIEDEQEKMLLLVLLKSKLQKYSLVLIKDVNEILTSLGIVQPFPKSKRGLLYDKLDLKSIRIINRLVKYLSKEHMSPSEFLKDLAQLKTIRYNKNQSQQLEIIKAENFFKRLHQAEIIKHYQIHENLSEFLAIHPDFTQFLLEKKIKKVIQVFSENQEFQEIGGKKKKLKQMKKYYDERKKLLEAQKKTNEYSSIKQDHTSLQSQKQDIQMGSKNIDSQFSPSVNYSESKQQTLEQKLNEPIQDIQQFKMSPVKGKESEPVEEQEEEQEGEGEYYYDEEEDQNEERKSQDGKQPSDDYEF